MSEMGTRTYATLDTHPYFFDLVKEQLEQAGHDQAIEGNVIDMHGLALSKAERLRKALHPSVDHVLQFFAYDHLPEKLQQVSRPFCELAHELAYRLPGNAETTICLRKLLEAKDCAIRALVAK